MSNNLNEPRSLSTLDVRARHCRRDEVESLKQILPELKRYSKFYQKVWLACSKIPAGETRTYKWIAEKIGKPNAARALPTARAAFGLP
ncbi:MAG: MGMT family protein, partial [Elusimicrobiota bacterium]|nr:MGMT family protein [Elusimicrobiota bacterium]